MHVGFVGNIVAGVDAGHIVAVMGAERIARLPAEGTESAELVEDSRGTAGHTGLVVVHIRILRMIQSSGSMKIYGTHEAGLSQEAVDAADPRTAAWPGGSWHSCVQARLVIHQNDILQ